MSVKTRETELRRLISYKRFLGLLEDLEKKADTDTLLTGVFHILESYAAFGSRRVANASFEAMSLASRDYGVRKLTIGPAEPSAKSPAPEV